MQRQIDSVKNSTKNLMSNIAHFKAMYIVLILAGLYLSFVSVDMWLQNIKYAIPITKKTFKFSSDIAHGSNDINNGTDKPTINKVWSGWKDYLIKVDLSTVTTLVIAITFVGLTIGIIRVFMALLSKPAATASPEEIEQFIARNKSLQSGFFPFWPGYVMVYVNLGLSGTLWGFIIAFNQATAEQIDITSTTTLMLESLGTALWSSFAGIFLAYYFCPPVQQIFRRFFVKNIIPEKEDTDETAEMVQALNNFTLQTHKAKTALEEFSKVTEEAKINLDYKALQNSLNQINLMINDIEFVKKSNENIYTSVKTFTETTNQRIQEITDTTNQKLMVLSSEIKEVKGKDLLREQGIEKNKSQLQELIPKFEEIGSFRAKTEQEIKKIQEKDPQNQDKFSKLETRMDNINSILNNLQKTSEKISGELSGLQQQDKFIEDKLAGNQKQLKELINGLKNVLN